MTRPGMVRVGAVGLALLSACGFLKSGTWEDDPGNWKRAFGGGKPNHVVVLHSKYWRSPHFTYEAAYFFAFEGNHETRQDLLVRTPVLQLLGDDAARAKENHFGDAPSWFAPDPVDRYEVWVWDAVPRGNFVVLVHRRTGVIFLSDYQV